MLDVAKMVDAVLDAIDRPLAALAGRLRAIEEKVGDLITRQPEKGEPGEAGKDGRDGKDGKDGRDGIAKDGRDGLDGKHGEKGEPGKDAFELEHFSVEHDGERVVTLKFQRGDEVQEHQLTLPIPIYRDVYRAERAYERGDMVTFGGSLWHANSVTEDKPGEGSPAWTLATKRGRDGRSVAK